MAHKDSMASSMRCCHLGFHVPAHVVVHGMQSGGESADGKGKSRYRSEREQALNKLAQVRYRCAKPPLPSGMILFPLLCNSVAISPYCDCLVCDGSAHFRQQHCSAVPN